MINQYYRKLLNIAWDSYGGQILLMKTESVSHDSRKEETFFDLLGKKEENPINPCTWLETHKAETNKPKLKEQFNACKKYMANLRLLHPYVRRNAEVGKCGGPTNRLKKECTHKGFYSDAIAYNVNVKSVECWLSCSALTQYIDEKLPRYEKVIQNFEVGFLKERKQKRALAVKYKKEQNKRLVIAKMKQKRSKLRASHECKLAKIAGIICESRAMYEQAKSRLIEEKKAGEISGYVDRNLNRSLAMGVQVTKTTLRRNLLSYKKITADEFIIEQCDGWVRGNNPEHPLRIKLDISCGN